MEDAREYIPVELRFAHRVQKDFQQDPPLLIIDLAINNNDRIQALTLEKNMFKQLSHDELEELLSTKDNVIIADVRDKDSFEESHIHNAIHLSMAALQEFCENADKTQPIMVYCYHGVSSQSVAQHLVEQGFTEVYSLIGGFETWKAQHSSSK